MIDLTTAIKAINNTVRMDILHWLKDPRKNFDGCDQLVDPEVEGVCVSIIQEKTQLSQSTVSSYLAEMQRANLVKSKRIGPWTYYKRDEENIRSFLEKLSQVL